MRLSPFRKVARRVRRIAQRAANDLRSRLRSKNSDGSEPREGGSVKCLAKALEERGIACEYKGGDPRHRVLAFSINQVAYSYSMRGALLIANADGSLRSTTDEAVSALLSHKNLANSILRRHGFRVPEGLAVHRDSLREACALFSVFLAAAEEGVCVKPAGGKRGRKVYVGVRDLKAFLSAFKTASRVSDQVLIEEVVAGTVYRFFCVGGRVVAIRCGVPPSIQGDGEHSIAQLLQSKNRERMRNPSVKEIRLTGPGRRVLEAQGMGLGSIPKAGETVWLNRVSNLDQGADVVDATESMHPSYIALVEQAVQKFPGLLLCGADVAIEDLSVPATDNNYHFIELNDDPGFEAHHSPTIGKPRDVAGAIVDYLMARS